MAEGAFQIQPSAKDSYLTIYSSYEIRNSFLSSPLHIANIYSFVNIVAEISGTTFGDSVSLVGSVGLVFGNHLPILYNFISLKLGFLKSSRIFFDRMRFCS